MLITHSECSRPVTPSPTTRESVSGTTARVPWRALHPAAQPPPRAGGEKISRSKPLFLLTPFGIWRPQVNTAQLSCKASVALAVHSSEVSQLLLTQQVLLLPVLGGAAAKPFLQHVSACKRDTVSWGGWTDLQHHSSYTWGLGTLKPSATLLSGLRGVGLKLLSLLCSGVLHRISYLVLGEGTLQCNSLFLKAVCLS